MRAAGLMLATAVAMLAFPRAAAGQIYNALTAAADAPEGPSATLDGAVNWRSGNTQLLDLTGGGLLRYRHDRHLLLLAARGAYGVKSESRYVSRDLEHLRYRITLWGPIEAEAFVQHDRDEFRRRELRVLGGLGPRLVLHRSATVDLALGVAYLPEYERLSHLPAAPDSGLARLRHRASSYLASSVHLGDRVKLEHVLYLQPALDDPLDLRAMSDLGLAVSLSKMFSLRLGYTLQLHSRPPVAVRSTDVSRLTSFQASF